ncbi:hypothetical protein AQUCO_01900125v1 [Aquilegia coerulea]|uniref:Uncharacterized protein n=1 Tax=Aquilegia coerulea TaxID=218851 RepID=A0A2G5DJ17_AQUCA|nr:hypothetical protein AQUCO_01900125v1 [Aquilegia coerulea]
MQSLIICLLRQWRQHYTALTHYYLKTSTNYSAQLLIIRSSNPRTFRRSSSPPFTKSQLKPSFNSLASIILASLNKLV